MCSWTCLEQILKMITTTILCIISLLLILLILYEIVYIFTGYKKDNKSDIKSVGNTEEVHLKPRNEIKSDEVTNNFGPYNGQSNIHTTIKTPLPIIEQAKIKSKGPAIVVTSPQF